MPPRIIVEPGLYRGHSIGRVLGIHNCWKGTWRHVFDPGWIIGSVLADDEDDAIRLAKECVDYRHRESLLALQLGRRLTMADLMAWKRVLCNRSI